MPPSLIWLMREFSASVTSRAAFPKSCIASSSPQAACYHSNIAQVTHWYYAIPEQPLQSSQQLQQQVYKLPSVAPDTTDYQWMEQVL